MSNLALRRGASVFRFKGLSSSQWGTQITCSVKSILDRKRFFQASKRQVPPFSVNFHPSVQNSSTLQLIYQQSLQAGFTAFQQFWGDQPDPPVITGIYVWGLAHPDFLVEMDAIAVVPL